MLFEPSEIPREVKKPTWPITIASFHFLEVTNIQQTVHLYIVHFKSGRGKLKTKGQEKKFMATFIKRKQNELLVRMAE